MRLEGLILCAVISEVEKEHFTLFDWPTGESRQGRGEGVWGGEYAIGYDTAITWSASSKPDGAAFYISSREIYTTAFFSLLLILDMEKK